MSEFFSHRYWPAIMIGLIVAAYWGRVLRLVQKTYKQTGRAANFWPAEPLGRALRIIWIPAVVLWIVIPFWVGAAGSLKWPCLRLLWTNSALEWIAVAIALLAFIVTIICWKKMGKSWRMGIDPGEKTQLVITGPYAYVRHPIYALSQVIMIMSIIAVPNLLMFIIGAIHLFFMQWEARREEKYLVSIHGGEYETYLQRVGRFVPKSFAGYRGAT